MLQFIRDLSSLIYPNLCLGCKSHLNREENNICLYCKCNLPTTDFHEIRDNKTEKLLWGRVHFHAATSYLYFSKRGLTQRLLHQLKYKNQPDLGIEMGRLFGKELSRSQTFRDMDFIIPVPLHKSKLALRGYNQSEMIALGMNEHLNAVVSTDKLVRIKNRATQTAKSRVNRWEGLSKDFDLRSKEIFEGRKILIVDDVITTGSTIEACCNFFKEIEGAELYIATLAIPVN